MSLARHTTLALALSLPLAACSGGGTSGVDLGLPQDPGSGGSGSSPGLPDGEPASFGIQWTDAPFEHALMEAAILRIDRITAHVEGPDDEEGGFLTVYEGPPVEVDLAPLRNGLTAPLFLGELPSGTWRQLRFHLESARLSLGNGNVYTTADGTLQTPSAAQSGLKVFFDPPLEVQKGQANEVIVDVDLTRSFRPIPAHDPENAMRYRLHPVLRAADRSQGGDLGGGAFATDPGSSAPDGPLVDATVYVLPKGSTDLDDPVATTASEPDGSWAILGLAPGEYDVFARRGELESGWSRVTVASGQTTAVDVLLD